MSRGPLAGLPVNKFAHFHGSLDSRSSTGGENPIGSISFIGFRYLCDFPSPSAERIQCLDRTGDMYDPTLATPSTDGRCGYKVDQISVHFGSSSQNILKSDLKKSLIWDQLIHFWPKSAMCVLH